MRHQTKPFSFTPKKWDSVFFGRSIHELSLNGPITQHELEAALVGLDQIGVWGIEVLVTSDRMNDVPILEDVGFRMVDSKMSFVSQLTTADIDKQTVPFGKLRQVRKDDMERISQLTIKHLVDNPAVYSRYKNPLLFAREESIRYYDAWNQRAFSEQPELFVVWEVDGEVVAYFNYMRASHHEFNPLFKGILTAVEPECRGQNAHNIMQSFLFHKFGESEWWIDNTTQVSNIAVIKNHIKAGKIFQSSSLIFFRIGQLAI